MNNLRFERLLVANRGEIACRVFRSAASAGLTTLGVRSADERDALHIRRCDEVVELPGAGPAAYLDVAALVSAAAAARADAVHPGYGFLSESAEFARACAAEGIAFVGPSPETLELFGDKARARALAIEAGVPVLPGTEGATSLAQARAFWEREAAERDAAIMVKAISGGGGRGVRVVRAAAELERAVADCAAEARAAFGDDALYVERFLPCARHVEVQVAGDASGAVTHLWDRDCSVQRRHQKLIEIAPSAVLPEPRRNALLDAGVAIAERARLRGVATVEFLATPEGEFYFLEVNPRIQVEHTVTEEVLGIDLVDIQFRLAAGESLAALELAGTRPRGVAVQVRINAETLLDDGTVAASGGALTEFDLAAGAGVRTEVSGYRGMTVNPRFDSLLAKVIVHGRDLDAAARLAARVLAESRIGGVETTLGLQRAVLEHADFRAGVCDTTWFERNLPELRARAKEFIDPTTETVPDLGDDLAGEVVRSSTGGAVVEVLVGVGDVVARGQTLLLIEAMKMRHPVVATVPGTVLAIPVAVGSVVSEGTALVALEPGAAEGDSAADARIDPEEMPPVVGELLARRALRYDAARPDAVAKRHRLGMRTARENIAAVTDSGLDVEYGGFAVAAQRAHRSLAELEAKTIADGIVTGLGRVNGDVFDRERSTCAILAYDYTVMAGTQGYYNHQKTDRVLNVARERRFPVVLFAEGGGGRPNDTDAPIVAGLHYPTFAAMGRLSGTVPTVGVVAGRCFAGNAALLGLCDVVIATENSNIGMAGPAMIEGGGLGVFAPEDIGPIGVQRRNGVVDVVVADETEGAGVARRYLSYFQGDLPTAEVADQRLLRHVVPADRKRAYDIRAAIDILFDLGSVLELRRDFAPAAITALARLDGRPVGVVANQPTVNGGAIDASAADKLARFLNLCDAYALPVVSLCDTPGFMVGPEAEKDAGVRRFARLFVLGGNMTVPTATIVLRKGYGLGALAMAAGGFHNTALTIAWPTGEFGGMGLEGAVRLGARDHLASIEDEAERRRQFDALVAAAYEHGSAVNAARHLEIDEVIDPVETRDVLAAALLSRPGPLRDGWINARRRVGVDTW
ncbi:carboxyl transferase domain-containing protein [Nocardia sp. NPDC003482]